MKDRRSDTLAGEFVLGSLPPAEHAEARRRIDMDPEFAEAVNAWERRLGPLADRIAPVRPPLGMLSRILARIPASRWSGLAWVMPGSIAAALLLAAVALLAIAAMVQSRHDGVMPILVAQLHSSDSTLANEGLPAFAVAIDQTAHRLIVNPVSVESNEGTRYSLWLVRARDERPITRATLSASHATVLPWRTLEGDLVGARLRISAGEDWTAALPWSQGTAYFEGVLVPAAPGARQRQDVP